MNSTIAAAGAPAAMPLCCSEPCALALDPHDARADAVGLFLAAVGAVVVALDDVLALGLGPHRQRQHPRRIGLAGHGLQLELDLLADRDPALLQDRLQRARRSACVGLGHVDVGQHLLDRVAFLEAQGELVAVGAGGSGSPAGLRPAAGRLAGLETLEIGGIEALEVGGGDRRRRDRGSADTAVSATWPAPDGRRGAARWSRIRAPSVRPMAPMANSDRPEQHEQRRWALSGRPDGGGESVMTVDLCGSGGPDLGLGCRRCAQFVPNGRDATY